MAQTRVVWPIALGHRLKADSNSRTEQLMAKSTVDMQADTSSNSEQIRVTRHIRVSLLQFAVHRPEFKS